MTTTWADLPLSVRSAVEQHVGPVVKAVQVVSGRNSDVTAVLYGTCGMPVFVKGVCGLSRRMRWLRNEIMVCQLAGGIAPGVLFHADVDDWLVVGFEYVPGRAASLVPGSADLPLVASTVERISQIRAPRLRPLRERWSVTDWWDKLAQEAPDVVAGWDVEVMSQWAALVPEVVDGDRLLHTDLHGDQFLIGAHGSVRVIDWGFPGAGAAWVDTAFLTLRLVEAGHQPDDALVWARSLASFSAVDDRSLTAFAVYVAGLWSYWAVIDPSPGTDHRARLARGYATWRLASGCGRPISGV